MSIVVLKRAPFILKVYDYNYFITVSPGVPFKVLRKIVLSSGESKPSNKHLKLKKNDKILTRTQRLDRVWTGTLPKGERNLQPEF